MTFINLNETAPTKVLKSVFDSFDADGNGVLDKTEFKALLSSVGIMNDSAQDAINLLADADGDGLVDKQEFYKWVKEERIQEIINDSKKLQFLCGVAAIFKSFDLNGNDTITWTEFRKYMCDGEGHTEETAVVFWYQIDTDNSGTITFSEFWAHTKNWDGAMDDDVNENNNSNNNNNTKPPPPPPPPPPPGQQQQKKKKKKTKKRSK